MRPRSRFLEASRGQRLLRSMASLSLALLLGGCGLYGDFDRVRPSLATDEANARIDREELIRNGGKPSNSPLTDEERQLRDLARAIIPPPNNPDRWDTVFRDYVLDDIEWLGTAKDKRDVVKFDRTAYWRDLHQDERRSGASAYAKLMTDAREDVIRIEPFFAIASRVADMDRKRDSVLALASTSSAAERSNARRRNQENVAIVMRVCRALGERMTSYNYALERLAIQAPSPMAADSERALTLLHSRIGQYCRSGQVVTAKG
jgi:hypothetical protein